MIKDILSYTKSLEQLGFSKQESNKIIEVVASMIEKADFFTKKVKKSLAFR